MQLLVCRGGGPSAQSHKRECRGKKIAKERSPPETVMFYIIFEMGKNEKGSARGETNMSGVQEGKRGSSHVGQNTSLIGKLS